ncbi:MAG: GGDEF domain-containing protein [Chitinivorax sp.]
MEKPNPSLIARETLKQLAQRKMVPSPANYRRIYEQIAGEKEKQPDLELSEKLLKPVRELAGDNPNKRRIVKQLEELAEEKKWDEFVRIFEEQQKQLLVSSQFDQPWPDLIRDLLRQWETRQRGVSSAMKKEALERVLINFGNDVGLLNEKIGAMLRSWGESGQGETGIETVDVPEEIEPEELAPETAVRQGNEMQPFGLRPSVVQPQVWNDWIELVRRTLECAVIARLKHLPELQQDAEALLVTLRQVYDEQTLKYFAIQVKKFILRLELQNDTEDRLVEGLLHLLSLFVDNISELVIDDEWLRGQIDVVKQLVHKPVNVRQIYAAEISFKEVVIKQGALKKSLNEAKQTFKSMIETFVSRLGSMSTVTGDYHDKVTRYVDSIRATDDLTQLNSLLADLMNDTRMIQLDMQRSRDELMQAKREAEEAEQRIIELEHQLEAASEKVREDHLTGALNRRGLDTAFVAEIARADREARPLSVSVIDIDNFKQLNDRLGHQAGDGALVHLVQVVKDTLRPTDVVARYGGEEFVVLLINTPLDEAQAVMTRLQRELTKRFFLHDNQKILITFSAGVTQFQPGDNQDSVIARADDAMYQAKKTGKNKVVAYTATLPAY